MTDQRSAFRFRIPRLRPPVPAPRPTTQTTSTRPSIREQQRQQQPPTRPQVNPQPRPPTRPQGTTPRPPPASALPSAPPPIRPQGTTPAQPLPVVQPAPQAVLASPPQPLPIPPQATTPTRPPVEQPAQQAAPAPTSPPQPPKPIQPQGTTPATPTTPALRVTPQEPTALPPTVPLHPLRTVPASPPQPVVELSTAPQDEPALFKTQSPAPVSQPTVPLHPLGTVPASPPVKPSAASIAPQDEPASISPKPTQVAPSSLLHSSIMPKLKAAKPQESTKTESQTSSPSQTTIQSRFSSPPSPSRVSSKSPPHSQPSSPPQVKRSIAKTQNNGQRGADPVLKATPTTETNEEIQEEAFTELSSVHSNSEPQMRDQPGIRKEENQHESEDAASTTSNSPNKPQTKSMISLPEEKIQNPESPNNEKLNEPQAPYCENTTGTNLQNHHLNDKSPSVITLAGKNRGTSMHIGSGATKRHWKIHIHRKYKVNPDEITDTTTDGEESSKEKKKGNDLKHNEDKDKNAYVNCNVQGINNSMVFNCSIKERNPGVHRGSSSIPWKKSKRNKVKVNITPSTSQKHTIRRRCLRGLFMESSSDSDPNHPQKCRRHGCRYKSNKDDKMDAV